MLFYEPLFLFLLLPSFLALFLASSRGHARKWVLIIGSVAFYCWGEPLFVPVVIGSTLIDYYVSEFLSVKSKWRPLFLGLGIANNLLILVFYKYCDFLIKVVNFVIMTPIFDTKIALLNISLPIGVSFIVFEKISYLVDVFRQRSPASTNLRDYCLFVFFFPKLLAGPIIKYHDISEQITYPKRVSEQELLAGFQRFALGIVKKLLVADPVGTFADIAFNADPGTLSQSAAWLGVLAFTIQIYFDFSAYSDMAIGLAKCLGFQLMENFSMPYLACSITEFWRRWHISLTTWVRDYLYVPLGGNRVSSSRTYLNLWICFLASGLWHGANWNFVIWGCYNGIFLVADRLFLKRQLDRLNPLLANGLTFIIIMAGWVIFRTRSLNQMATYYGALLNPFSGHRGISMSTEVAVAMIIGCIVCVFPRLPMYKRLAEKYQTNQSFCSVVICAILVMFVVACGRSLAAPFQPFLYFRF